MNYHKRESTCWDGTIDDYYRLEAWLRHRGVKGFVRSQDGKRPCVLIYTKGIRPPKKLYASDYIYILDGEVSSVDNDSEWMTWDGTTVGFAEISKWLQSNRVHVSLIDDSHILILGGPFTTDSNISFESEFRVKPGDAIVIHGNELLVVNHHKPSGE